MFLFLLSMVAAHATPTCFVCTSGTSYYSVPVHGYPSSAQEDVSKESLRVCRIIIRSWGKDATQCQEKGCGREKCVVEDPGHDHGHSPFCNDNASCGFGSFCIGGRCVTKDDPFENKCHSDAQCGGTFGGHGRCVLGRCQ